MRASSVKAVLAAAIAVSAAIGVALVGFTADEEDPKQGVMLDFAYYNVEWVEMDLSGGMNGMDALFEVCRRQGYPDPEMNPDGSVRSVNNHPELTNVKWGMFVLNEKGGWSEVANPSEYDVSGEKIVSWARTGPGSEMMPAVDQTGFTYYSYAAEGRNQEGAKLKIITLAPSVTETVTAVGGLEYIIGTDRYSDFPAALVQGQEDGSISIVGGYTDPNYEKIVSKDPDIVFLDGGTGEHVSMADKLRKSGIQCVVLYTAVDTDDLMKNLWICASALGFPKNGNDYIARATDAINDICRITHLSDRKVFVSLGISDSPYTAGSGTYITSMLESLGADNIFSGYSDSWFMVNKESVYDKQPDIIIVIYDTGEIASQREYRKAVSRFCDLWKETPAYANGEVYIFSGDAASLLSRAGARLPDALELMAKILDPDSFVAADPTDIVGKKYYNSSYNDADCDYLKYVKSRGLLEWQR